MVEYLYNCIRAVAGQDIAITAAITDDEGATITKNCSLTLHDDNGEIVTVEGNYINDEWLFIVEAKYTKGLKGRYWYCIRYMGNNLCFKEPIYLI